MPNASPLDSRGAVADAAVGRPPLDRCTLFDAVEESYEVTGIQGRVPDWLRGTYYINGPARFERAGRRYKNWIDGDGMVCALDFSENGVRFTSRFVQTAKLRQEEAEGEFLYRAFGTAFPGDRLRHELMLETPANINVCRWQGHVLAFGEQSLPIELDPHTLATRAEFDFGGILNDVSPFSAHAKVDPATGHLLNFGISFSARQAALTVYEFEAPGRLLRRSRYPLEHHYANHDFAITPGHVVFFLSPLLMDIGRFLGDRISVMESLDWRPDRGSRILVTPRKRDGRAPFSIAAGEGYCLHLINAFERTTNGVRELVIDIIELERPLYPEYQPMPQMFVDAPVSAPVRYVVDLDRGTLRDRQPLPYQFCSDFPSIDARRTASAYDDFWFLGISETARAGPKFFDELVHASWRDWRTDDVFRAPPGTYLGGEPVLLHRPGQAAPHEELVIVQELDLAANTAAFLLFPANEVHRGPVVRLPLRHRLHPLFHAGYYPASAAT